MGTLPKTRAHVPDVVAPLILRPTGQMLTANGVALRVHVYDPDGALLGELANDGNGGGTWFRHAGVGAMHWWREINAEYQAMPEALAHSHAQSAEFGFPPLDEVGQEALADVLVEEAFAR